MKLHRIVVKGMLEIFVKYKFKNIYIYFLKYIYKNCYFYQLTADVCVCSRGRLFAQAV